MNEAHPGAWLASVLSTTGSVAWGWHPDDPETLCLTDPSGRLTHDIRPQVEAAHWSRLSCRLRQALADGEPFRMTVALRGGRTSGGALELIGARERSPGKDGRRVVGLSWHAPSAAVQEDEANWAPLAKLSHELRSPLAAVRLQIEQLRYQLDDADAQDVLASMLKNTGYMAGIIDDMMRGFRAGDQRSATRRTTIETADLVEQIVPVAEDRAWRKGLSFSVRRQPGFPDSFLSDTVALRRILQNLLDNAIKYTAEGGVRLGLKVARGGDRPMLRFEVTDTGPGMSEQDIARAFVPFAKGDAGQGEDGDGLGIGLALSRQLATELAGDLEVRSTPGVGSRFVLSVPSRCAQEAADREAPAAPARQVPQGIRVLLVDDESLLLRMTAKELARLGCEVDIADSARAGLDSVDRHVPDVVILDLDLPDMSGCDLCRQLRERMQLAHCRFVAYSGSDEPAHRRAAARAGFHDFLVKPATARELLGL
jgi:signal transduction histidine kinase/CheY-like chemotaxis protein